MQKKEKDERNSGKDKGGANRRVGGKKQVQQEKSCWKIGKLREILGGRAGNSLPKTSQYMNEGVRKKTSVDIGCVEGKESLL